MPSKAGHPPLYLRYRIGGVLFSGGGLQTTKPFDNAANLFLNSGVVAGNFRHLTAIGIDDKVGSALGADLT